jgi:hypothetical protein
MSHYRLKLVSKDGNHKYSQVRTVTIEQLNQKLRITPNPVRDHAAIQFSVERNEAVDINIIDAAGKRIMTTNVIAKSGFNQIPLKNVNSLLPGVYMVQVVNQSKTFNTKMIVR